MIALAFDIEADNLLPGLANCWCIGIADVTSPHDVQSYSDHDDKLPSIQEALDRMMAADRLVAHNGIGYDVPAIKKLYGVDLGYHKQWDTMTIAALLNPEKRSLKLSIFGEAMGFPKGDYDDWEGGYTDEMRIYMERDVEITALLYGKQQEELQRWADAGVDMTQAVDIELGVQKILAQQNQHGFRLDVESAQELDSDLRSEMGAIEIKLQDVFPPRFVPERAKWCFNTRTWLQPKTFIPKANNKRMGYVGGAACTKLKQELFNASSRAQIAQRLSQTFGWKPTQFNQSGTVVVDESTLKGLDFPSAKLIQRYLRLSKQIGMLSEGKNAWLRLHQEGRLHGYVRSCGARTHRMTHAHPNLAQVDKDSRMRSLFVANHGDKLVGADASGLELRLMAAYLYTVDAGKYADSVLYGSSKDGTDVHSINQRLIGLHKRDSAKVFFYAFLYGAGNGKLGEIICDDAQAAGQPRPKGRMDQIGGKARKAIEKGITGLEQLIAYAQATAERRGYLTLPDGRPVQSTSRTALNSLLQGSGAVLMKKAAVIFDQRLVVERGLVGKFDYCANVHDELQVSAHPDVAEAVGQALCDSIEMAGVELGYKVPFAGEYDVGDNWSQTH